MEKDPSSARSWMFRIIIIIHHHIYSPIITSSQYHKNNHTIGGLPEKPYSSLTGRPSKKNKFPPGITRTDEQTDNSTCHSVVRAMHIGLYLASCGEKCCTLALYNNSERFDQWQDNLRAKATRIPVCIHACFLLSAGKKANFLLIAYRTIIAANYRMLVRVSCFPTSPSAICATTHAWQYIQPQRSTRSAVSTDKCCFVRETTDRIGMKAIRWSEKQGC